MHLRSEKTLTHLKENVVNLYNHYLLHIWAKLVISRHIVYYCNLVHGYFHTKQLFIHNLDKNNDVL